MKKVSSFSFRMMNLDFENWFKSSPEVVGPLLPVPQDVVEGGGVHNPSNLKKILISNSSFQQDFKG